MNELERDVRIESVAFGGDGVARVDGRAVFVPYSAPGDLLRVRLVDAGKRFEGEVVSILEPSPARVAPACPHFGTCGGCQLQHVAHAAQLEAKRAFVRDALTRLGGIAEPPTVEMRSGAAWAYRVRAEFAIDSSARPPRLGFRRRRSHDVVDVERCPVLAPPLQAALEQIRARGVPRGAAAVHVTVGDDATASEFVDERGRVLGEDAVAARTGVAGFTYGFAPRSFAQAHAELLPGLVEAATSGVRGGLAFDLYCGAGLFALPLSRAFARVLGVESDPRAIESARANARDNGVENATFESARVEQWLRQARRLAPEFVVVDPPRSGLAPEAVAELGRMRDVELRYVSCDPATLARDVRGLLARGFTLERVSAFDLFPQTYHVEVVAVLRRSGSVEVA